MAPTPELTNDDAQAAMPHAGRGNATQGPVTFYASLSLLGISVIFLIGCFIVKACKPGAGDGKYPSAKSRSQVSNMQRSKSDRPARAIYQLFTGRGRHTRSAEHTSPGEAHAASGQIGSDAQNAETEAWAAAYLRHVRNMEDYAAGMPHVIQSQPAMPTPPPLYSAVCPASSGTIGIARELDRKTRLSNAPSNRVPPTDSEADIADILGFYSDSDSTGSTNSSLSSVATPDVSLSEDFFPAIPAIIVDGCEDVVPPPYEEDIADQITSSSVLYLQVPSPKSKVDGTSRSTVLASGTRRKSKAGQQRSPSIIARFTSRDGFFRVSRTRQPRTTGGTA